ncbi:serine O-acetyltransferase EpsC [Halobacteriaceae archaeon SHR40]|uniref:serine O-acetyltransferase EpsC n=1 Tax=Halovenus amylolytica TaxID=2500550 RepID=UPI000FE39340
MQYEHSGDVHRRLRDSYAEDGDELPTLDCPEFPERTSQCAEIDILKTLFFPRCWNSCSIVEDKREIEEKLNELGDLFYRGMCPYVAYPMELVANVIETLPEIRAKLKKDLEAAFKGDPAAKTHVEVVRSYPGFHAIMVQRVAHEIYNQGAKVYARELTEAAKTVSGIDIHPGAEIGEYFFIDHGTGVVIGETTTIGDWVRIYQDVTLGALHFEHQEDDEHALKKDYKRHPDIGNNVVIGAGSKILGAITIGDHVSIGANSWVTDDIPDHTKVYVSEHPKQERKRIESPQD